MTIHATPTLLPRALRRPVRLAAAVAISVTVLGGLPLAGAHAATVPVPRSTVAFRTIPEVQARYVGQVSCEPATKPGTAAFRQLIIDTYGPSNVGTLRACASGGRSEHKDGRALDWMLSAFDLADKATADAFLAWLVGPDEAGVPAGNAHRLGVMYVIWNGQTWEAWTGRWKPYTGASPHTDHIHVSLSWDGALKRTSWWTGAATARYDYGPCQVYIGELAKPYSGPRYTPCPAPVPRPAKAFPRLWDSDQAADVIARTSTGAMLLYPGSGTGAFRRARQIGYGWTTMNLVTAAGDLNKDGKRDLVARDASGRLHLYRGNGIGGFSGRQQIGSGWSGMDAVLGVGDLDASGTVDLLARRASDGAVYFYPGSGAATFGRARAVGDLSGHDLVTAVGDWDGDTQPDIVSRDPAGRLFLHPGDGRGGLRDPRQIGVGWGTMNTLVGPGDFNGDGRVDIISRRSDGTLWLYRGNGTGGFAGGARIGWGWSGLALNG